jgi:hypothetical protein
MPYYPPPATAGSAPLLVQDEGLNTQAATLLNFVGTGVTASVASNTGTITISAGAASAGGLDRSIQYNDSTAISGSNLLDVDLSGNLVIGSLFSGTDALVPPVGNLTLFVRKRAGRSLLSYIAPSGLDGPYQPMLGMNRVFVIQGGDGSNALTTWGAAAPTVTGAVAARTPLATNFSSSLKRLDYVASIAAGQAAGINSPTANLFLGSRNNEGGFYAVFRAILAHTGTVITTRYFFGFQTGVAAAPANIDPAAYVNAFGVIKNATGTTYNFFHCDGTTGNNRQIDTGITYRVGDVVEVRIYAKPSATAISMSLEILSVGGSGAVGVGGTTNPMAEYATSGNLTACPTNTTMLAYRVFCQASVSASGPKIGIVSVYGETDN